MAEDFTPRLPYGLSDLPAPPPDDFNRLYPPNDLASMGTQQMGGAQFVPAGFRLPLRRMSPPYPAQGGLAPGGGQLPEIPIPEWWKVAGPMLQILPRIITGSGSGAERDTPECKKQWEDARDFCVQELAKRYPNTNQTGGHTNVDDCAKGRVDERCGGNSTKQGYQPKTGNQPETGDKPKTRYQPKKRRTHWHFGDDDDGDGGPPLAPE